MSGDVEGALDRPLVLFNAASGQGYRSDYGQWVPDPRVRSETYIDTSTHGLAVFAVIAIICLIIVIFVALLVVFVKRRQPKRERPEAVPSVVEVEDSPPS